jgi:hypothetical protein
MNSVLEGPMMVFPSENRWLAIAEAPVGGD